MITTLNDVRRLVRHVINERIRSGSSKGQPKRKFKMNEFKKLFLLKQCNEYAKSRLKLLGWGSSRDVYLLSSSKVLKIAKTETHTSTGDAAAGFAQNKAEVEISKNQNVKNVVAKIHDFDPDFKWIVSDLVHQFDGDDQMVKALKISQSNKLVYIDTLIERITKFDEGIEELMDYNPQDVGSFSEFIEGIRELVDIEQLHPQELDSGHFGKTRDGRVVLFDYGGTLSVIGKFY